MNRKKAKTVQQILLVIACLAALFGTVASMQDEERAGHDVSKIQVQVIGKESADLTDDSSGCYEIGLTYQITNQSKVCWNYLEVTTYVYDKDGNSLGKITTSFGEPDTAEFQLDVRKSETKEITLTATTKDGFFATLYDNDLSVFKFESEVTYGKYYAK